MTTFKLFVAACLCAAAFTACSNEKNDTPDPDPTPKEDFSLVAPDGKLYTNGQVVTISSLDQSGAMRFVFDLKNNTPEVLTLTMSQKILNSDYNKISDHATFCWSACYPTPLPEDFVADPMMIAANYQKELSGDMLNIDPTTPSFEAKVEYTITNTANSEKRTLVGHYKYTKK